MKSRCKSISGQIALMLVIGLILVYYPVRPVLALNISDAKLQEVLIAVKNQENSLTTFIAGFKQIKKTELLVEPLISAGKIFFSRSGKIRVQVQSPDPFEVLLANKKLVIFDPVSNRVKTKYIGSKDAFMQKYFGFGLSLSQLKERYKISAIFDDQTGSYIIKLYPKKKSVSKIIQLVEITVKKPLWLPEKLFFLEKKGDSTELQLQYEAINEDLPQKTFDIKLPLKEIEIDGIGVDGR